MIYRPHQIEPCPVAFPEQFVIGGWRRVENVFSSRTSVLLRWMDECGRDRLSTLRSRYRRGDLSALDEVRATSVAPASVRLEV